jgi:rhamnogalacturonyl hydrolase YesR
MKIKAFLIPVFLILALQILIAREGRFDFGTETAPPGYVGITGRTRYTSELGYGWISAGDVNSGSQDKPGPLYRDFCWSPGEAEFRIDVNPGIYLLTFTTGDMYVANHATQLEIDGLDIRFPFLDPEPGEFLQGSTAFSISLDHLVIRIKPGKDNWLLNVLTLEPCEKELPVQVRPVSFGSLKENGAGKKDEGTSLDPILQTFLSHIQNADKITSTGVTCREYLDLIRANVNYFRQFQDAQGAIMDPYEKKESPSATSAYALCAATLVRFDAAQDLVNSALRAMDWTLYSLGQEKASSYQGEAVTPFLTHAIPLLEQSVGNIKVVKWKRRLLFDPRAIYKDAAKNGSAMALDGESMLYSMGLRDDPSYVDSSLKKHERFFTPLGLYKDIAHPGIPYDLFTRMWFTDMMASGYSGNMGTSLSERLRQGALTTLFLQSPAGELPTGGPGSQYQWNEAQLCALFECNALFAHAERNAILAGVFKRAARRAFLSLKRWQRPTGELFIVKNRLSPDLRHGYDAESSFSGDNLSAVAMMALAYEYASRTDDKVKERPTPAEIGGFIIDLREGFSRVIANAGGMYVELDTSDDRENSSTGLIRIHSLAGNPQMGPSDGLLSRGQEHFEVSVGASWMGRIKKDWIRLAELDSSSIQEVFLNKLKESRNHVSFEISYLGTFDGPVAIVERYDIKPGNMDLSVLLEGYDGAARFVWPVLSDDGENKTTIETRGNTIRVAQGAASQSFTALNAGSVRVNDALYPSINGWAKLALAEYSSPKAMTLRIEPNKDWDALLREEPDRAAGFQGDSEEVLDPKYIRQKMKKVFRYTVAHPTKVQNAGWERAAFYTGVMAAYKATRDEEYLNQAIKWAAENKWELADNKQGYWFADNQTCAQTYLDIFFLKGGEEKIAHAKKILDEMAASPPQGRKEWWWCDALYMAPPVFVRMAKATGNNRYNDIMYQLWWDTRDFLYDQEASLFYRDENFFPEKRKTRNEKKIFWSRGNGWVMGGLVRVLEYFPDNDPRYTDFLQIYRDMADALADVQGQDGLWRASLLDPEEWPMPETSGTGFFCYALLWGINNHILNPVVFTPVAQKAWTGLASCVYPDGKLGWVQYVAGSPGPVSPYTMREYAPGAFLLAGSEMLKMAGENETP